MQPRTDHYSRRVVLERASAGLVIHFSLLGSSELFAAEANDAEFESYIKIGSDNHITIVTPAAEIGQGVFTTLPKILCEELGADFAAINIELPYGDEHKFGNPAMGGRQTIGGSTSTAGYFLRLRKIGAAAREMLVSAAAARWGVEPRRCRASGSVIIDDIENRRLTFGEVAVQAALLPIPQEPALKAKTHVPPTSGLG